MSNLSKIALFLFCLPLSLFGQEDASLGWIKELAKEVQEETDLCESCTWIPPAISEVAFNNRIFYFLRYGCSTTESVARMYDPDGTFLGECKSNDDDFVCNPSDVDAFITYTFANSITILWSCETGYDCDFALAYNINPEVPIFVDDTRCTEGIKSLKVSDKFVTYEWEGNGLVGTKPILEIEEGGIYGVTVTDEKECAFFGAIEVPDITKLAVNIKGPNRVCTKEIVELKTADFQSYLWSTGEMNKEITISETGDYRVTVTNEQNCEGIAMFTLENYPPLDIEINTDKIKVTEGNSVNISVNNTSTSRPIIAFEWSGNSPIDCSTCPETTYSPKIDNEIQVSVLDENGCFTTAIASVEVESLPVEIYAPNIFKLNSTNRNQRFTLYGGTNVQRIEVLNIFNRWGNLLYEKNDFLPNQTAEGWDGTSDNQQVPSDIYLFQAIVLFTNGERKTVAGDILLLR